MAPKLTLTFNKGAERELADRVERLKRRGRPIQLDPLERVVHFLRNEFARYHGAASVYLFLGANAGGDGACAIEGYPGAVLKHAVRFSSIGTVSLCCRKVFDHKANGLTGANFAKSSDETCREPRTTGR